MAAARHPRAPTARRPKRKVHAPAEAMKEEARRGSRRWPVPASAKGGMKPKQAAGKDESSDKKAQTKGKGEQGENRRK